MIVRKIKPDELKRTNELFAIAFEFPDTSTKSALEVYEDASQRPKTREDYYWQERWAAFEDDDRTMMSFFVAKPYPIHFDGHKVTMTGIGGVASLPQYRRMGGIRGCFEASLPAMYEDGAAFSYLYPFSTSYYRKFGYEMCCERLCYHLRLNTLKQFPIAGSCRLLEQPACLTPQIKSIYEAWQNKYNMMVMNESYEYAWITQADPVKDQQFTYLYESADGTPKAFMTFTQVNDADGRNIKCSRFFFTDTEGLKGLLNLAAALGSDHSYLILELPSDIDISLLFPEWSMGGCRCDKLPCGMARVINAEKVLRLARCKGNGSLTIRLTDTYIPQNNNTFTLTFQENKENSVSITEQKPDITLNINHFSRLITGACGHEALPYMDGIQVDGDMRAVEQVFYKKPVLITEYF